MLNCSLKCKVDLLLSAESLGKQFFIEADWVGRTNPDYRSI